MSNQVAIIIMILYNFLILMFLSYRELKHGGEYSGNGGVIGGWSFLRYVKLCSIMVQISIRNTY